MSSKRLSIPKRGDPNEGHVQTRNIRFDYSDIHLENELLNNELENVESDIHRQKFQKTVDSDEIYKKAKKDADVMLQLKNAVNNRKPHTSFERVSKSAGVRPKFKATVQKQKTLPGLSNNTSEPVGDEHDQVDGSPSDSESSSEHSRSESHDNQTASKPFNTLTMFLLSLQRFKSAGKNRKTNISENKDTQEEKDSSVKSSPCPSRPSSYNPRSNVYPRANYNTRAKSAIQASVAEKYGIHVKKDHSRSRRTLGEISKLEHDTKYGHVDKFEERRKSLLAACKNTQTLDLRIEKFLKDVDHFKKVTYPDNSLDRVLMRSKSAYGVRSQAPEAW